MRSTSLDMVDDEQLYSSLDKVFWGFHRKILAKSLLFQGIQCGLLSWVNGYGASVFGEIGGMFCKVGEG